MDDDDDSVSANFEIFSPSCDFRSRSLRRVRRCERSSEFSRGIE